MRSKRRLAMALLLVVAVAELGVAAVMLTAAEADAPPLPVPLLIIVFAVGSVAAAFGLSRGQGWAIPLGIGSRALDALFAVPGILAGSGAEEKGPAAVVVVLSIVTIVVLVALSKEEAQTGATPARTRGAP